MLGNRPFCWTPSLSSFQGLSCPELCAGLQLQRRAHGHGDLVCRSPKRRKHVAWFQQRPEASSSFGVEIGSRGRRWESRVGDLDCCCAQKQWVPVFWGFASGPNTFTSVGGPFRKWSCQSNELDFGTSGKKLGSAGKISSLRFGRWETGMTTSQWRAWSGL